MPKLEVPAEFREMIDKGVAQARDAYAKAKAAGEEAADRSKHLRDRRQGRNRLQSQADRDFPYRRRRGL